MIYVALFVASLGSIAAQADTVLFSFGLNVGKVYPAGRIKSAPLDNIYAGRALNGSFLEFHTAYHLSDKYRIVGNLTSQIFNNSLTSSDFEDLVPDFKFATFRGYMIASINIGVQRSYPLISGRKFSYFINPNIGIEVSETPFDGLTFRESAGKGNLVDARAVNIDRQWSPVFNMAAGLEFPFFRHFAFKVKGNYFISNLGTEDVVLAFATDPLIPNIDIGWVHRFSVNFGFSMHLFKKKLNKQAPTYNRSKKLKSKSGDATN
jgi:hypothetical protein